MHENQYRLIKGRTIQDYLAWAYQFLHICQDCLAWAYQFRHICHHPKREIMLLKLDFEKAFDKVENHMISSTPKGFSQTWIKWIKSILASRSSSVLLNGVPGKPFKCKRGVRQWDPLSPLLFVLAADLLKSIINKGAQMYILEHLLGTNFGGDYPIIQYADDTLIILPANAKQLLCLKALLRTFA